MAGNQLSVERVEKALRKYNGILSLSAEACGVARTTLYRFIEKHPHLKEVRTEVDENLLDVAESNVVSALSEADMKTTRWYLERKGKDRGYVTRQEQTGKDGTPLQVTSIKRTIVDPVKKKD